MPVYLDETDHHALVIDIGTTSTKLGHAGELYPRIISPNYIKTTGQLNDNDDVTSKKNRQFTTLSHINSRQYLESDFPETDVVQLIGKDYEITDFQLFEEILQQHCSKTLQVDLSQTPILVSDSICALKGQRQKISEMLFEKFRIPSVYFANNSILTSFANGKVSSFIVDVGENSTILAPILEGYILQKLMIRSPLSGQLIKACARAKFDKLELDYTPKYLTEIMDADPMCTRTSQFKNLSNALIDLEMNGFIESVLEVSLDPLNRDSSDITKNSTPTPMNYEFPNRHTNHSFHLERSLIPEVFFDTSQLLKFEEVGNGIYSSTNQMQLGSIPELTMTVFEGAGQDLRNLFANNFTLVGGTTLLKQFRTRFNNEISRIAGVNLLKPHQMPSQDMVNSNTGVQNLLSPTIGGFSHTQIKHSSWIGGSMLGSLSEFDKLWTTRLDYEERKLVEED